MICYKCNDIQQIAQSILNKNVSVFPVGNHHLERNLVYHIKTCDKSNIIFKLFLKKNRWNREVASLRLLSNSNIKCPALIDYGKLKNGCEWLMTSFFEGDCYDSVEKSISEGNKYDIYTDMGRELGKIHSIKEFDFYGNWDETGNSVDAYRNYYDYFLRHVNTILVELNNQSLPDNKLISSAVKKLLDNIHIVKSVKHSFLCHNDFGERNAIVTKSKDTWKLNAIIDFEQSMPADKDKDILFVYKNLINKNCEYQNAFLNGYKEFGTIDDLYYAKENFYMIYFGLYICSWAFYQAPEHYAEGIDLLKKYV